MIIDGHTIKSGDQVIYRGFVATYEGDELGSFTLAREDSYEQVISFPWSLETIFEHVDTEINDKNFSLVHPYEVIIF